MPIRLRPVAALFGALLVLAGGATSAHAQATRTWVSGVGDDVNPCSRTAPCKTFAGAISKTADPGEIDALDPGGFGTVTITKSVTIDGSATLASVLASGVQGVVVNAPGDDVVLRGLTINGDGTTLGTNGVNVIAARSVTLDNVSIGNFSSAAVVFSATTAARVLLHDVVINHVPTGVKIPASATGDADVELHDTAIEGAADGVVVQGGGTSKTLLDGVSVMSPTQHGVQVSPSAGAAPRVLLRDTTITGANPAVQVDASGYAGLVGSLVANNALGLMHNGTGQIEDLGGNTLTGNSTDGTFTVTPPPPPTTTVTVTTPAPPPVTNTVTLTVTKVVCSVTNLTGLTLSQARTTLSTGHCRTGTVKTQATRTRSKVGRVVAQSVKAGTQTGEGTAVALTIGRKA